MDAKKLFCALAVAFLIASLFFPLINFDFQTVEAMTSGTFGETSSTSTASDSIGADDLYGGIYTSPSSFVHANVQNITWYGHASAGTINVKAVLVDNATLTIVAVSDALAVNTTAGWHTQSFSSPPVITSSTVYTLMIIASSAVHLYYNDVGTGLIDASNSYASPTDPTDATARAYHYLIYASYNTYDIDLSSNPEVNATIDVNGTDYTTADSFNGAGTYIFTAESALVYGSNGYVFDHWLVNGSDSYATETVNLAISADTTVAAHYNATDSVYAFYGPFDETTGLLLSENVTVTAHYSDTVPNDEFLLTAGSYAFVPSGTVQYFSYLFSDNDTREYWIDPSEDVSDIYVFRDDDLTDYVINFLDYTGILDTYPYVTAKTYVNGTLFTVEKRKVDADNTFSMALLNGRKYQLVVGNEAYSYTYGDLLMTATTAVQLVLRGVDFPKETLLMYPYLTIYGLRDFTSNSIYFQYNDTKEQTLNFTLTITTSTGTVAYTYTTVANSLGLNWTSAVDSTAYTASVEIEHTTYGDFTWNQYFPAAGGSPVSFDFSFLGQWTFNSQYLFPALLIMCVAACFSALNAEVGAVLSVIVAIALSYLGWIPIPMGALVSGFALAILMALIYNKRRVQVY